MLNQFSRTELIYGSSGMKKLASSRVAVFGAGGVGGYTIEALARSGIGALDIIDNDTFSLTNINRQVSATLDTVGQYKVDTVRDRILSINPKCIVTVHRVFYLPENEDIIDFSLYDYVGDAIDTVAGKLAIITNSQKAGIPVISSMGTGNKTDPTAFKIVDLYSTSDDPLARVMRTECRKRGIESLNVVWSPEKAVKPADGGCPCAEEDTGRRSIPGSVAFVPSVAGLIMAGKIINDIVQK